MLFLIIPLKNTNKIVFLLYIDIPYNKENNFFSV